MRPNELRKDYLLDRWVAIATERSRRPTDFAKKKTRHLANTADCPMCPGNEHLTPPAVVLYLRSGKRIVKAKDNGDVRRKNWLVRVVPNLYPAFSPPEDRLNHSRVKSSRITKAFGHHEVLVESPRHDEHPANASSSQLVHVINAYIDRLRELSTKSYVQYVSVFRNHGLEAGASLSHAHSQIIAMPIVPRIIKEETVAARKHFSRNHRCIFCQIIEKERNGPRLVLENSKFIAFAPYASINPMEFWIFPVEHESSLLDISVEEIGVFSDMLKECLSRLKCLVNDPPYNYGFHLSARKEDRSYYHWHLEVYPRLATWAGFEKSTGTYINTITPETAAESLRNPVSE